MQNYQIVGSIGVKSNRAIQATITTKAKVRRPSASKLKSLGYTASQRKAILESWA